MRTAITTGNRVTDDSDIDTLKLAKGARARIVVVEEPVALYVHELRAPKIVDGHGVKETRKGKSGEYEGWTFDFIGKHVCLGRVDVIQGTGRGLDPEKCPHCEASAAGESIDPPKRRFAMNVVQYGIVQGGFQLAQPFSAKVIPWSFTENRFNKLVSIAEEHGDLKRTDLLLGPCDDAQYQKYEFAAGSTGQAVWQYNDQTRAFMAQLWGNPANRATEEQLELLCGRRKPLQYMQEDAAEVRRRWAIINRAGSGEASGMGEEVTRPPAGQLSKELDGLVPAGAAQPAAAPVADPFAGQVPAAASAADPFGGQAEANPAAGGTAEFAAPAAAAADPFAGATPAAQPATPAASPAPTSAAPADPFGTAVPATTTPTAAPAAASPSPTAPSPAVPADPFGSGPASAPASSGTPTPAGATPAASATPPAATSTDAGATVFESFFAEAGK